MTVYADDVNAKNDESLRVLTRSLSLSQGQFSLILARCNYRSLRQRLMQQLRRCPIEFRERVLDPSAKTIETVIQQELEDEPPPAMIISGLEVVHDLNAVLVAANQARDEFRKNFPFPLVLWGTDEVLRRLIRVAPDFESWAATPIEFEMATAELIAFIQETADEVFAKVLEAGAGIFLDNAALNLETGSPLRAELESARRELQSRNVKLDPELEASLEFVLGRVVDGSEIQSRQHYERSLELWHSPNLERRGCVLYSLGIWWRTYATRHHADYEQACRLEKDYFQQCVEVFEQTHRQDLVAKFINALGVILQELQQWDELEVVARKALALHQTYPDPFKLARTYGFLAEVALAKLHWTEAKQFAEQALQIVASAGIPDTLKQNTNLEWVHSYHQGWYLLSLARSQQGLGQSQEALKTLETAIAETKPYYDPTLYIRILEKLRSLYFEQGNYLRAFEIKQDQRSIEQQYGFRAFVGPGRLQPKQQIINPALAPVEAQKTVTQEITASGRQQDVNRLIERLGRNDHKLTVLQGQSGVGKSSILQAGLIPALKQKTIGTRNVLPVLQQVYTDWLGVLGQRLKDALIESGNLTTDLNPQSPSLENNGEEFILNQLRRNADNNLLSVLIFDQFEEFFFVCKEPSQRRLFYEFLRDCLNISYVKVILSLREDYLYYLLECNNRLVSLDVINNNILDKNILYYIGNFSVKDAKSVIQSLTEQTQFFLEPELIDALVQDLAGELGEVRPIELQVVGAELQTEKITRLEQYREHGPKEKLVGRFLEEVVKDCGPENEQIAKLVLYLLTDENNTRPLKTRADLELELDVPAEKLDLVLEIFVKSRLVFQVPALPVDRYQLVHDYLVAFVRQQQSARLIAELDKEREQRKLTETKLNQILKQQLQTARRAGVTLAALLLLIGGFAVLATVGVINTYITSLSLSSSQKQELDNLVTALKAGRQLKHLIGAVDYTQLLTVTTLNQAVYGVREVNRLEGHTNSVNSISFSRDGHLIASASEDKTVKLWKTDGMLLKTLKGHDKGVTSTNFSPDGKLLASASKDKTIRLWKIDGTLLSTLRGHSGSVTSVSFSPDGKTLASSSEDKTVKLWKIDGTLLNTLKGHFDSVIGVSFSPDGKTLASASKDDSVKLWSLEGKEIRNINNYGPIAISFSPDGRTIELVNKDKTVKYWTLDGTLLRNLKSACCGESFATMSFSPNLKLLASVNKSEDSKVQLQLIEDNGKYTYYPPLEGHSNSVTNVSFSPDGKLLASASKDNTVKLWRINKDVFELATDNKSQVTRVRFSPDGKMIAVASDDNTVKLWQRDRTLRKTLQGYGSGLTFSPDSQTVAAASADNVLKVWSLNSGETKTLKEPSNAVASVSVSPDGKIVASINSDKTVSVWRSDGTLINTLKEQSAYIKSVSFSPDSKLIASVGADNAVILWRSSDGTLIKTLKSHTDSVTSVSFSPDSKLLASSGHDNIVDLWRSDGTFIKILKGHSNQVTSVSFSPNSKIIASVSKGGFGDTSTIKLWRSDGEEIRTIDNYGIDKISFSPDSRIVASINTDKTVKLWGLEGTLIATLNGHNADVNSVSFSPDSEIIASASDDNTVKLWSLDGEELKTLRHSDKVNSVSFSPDGRTITSTGSDYSYYSYYGRQNYYGRYNYTINLWKRDGTHIKTLKGHSNRFNTTKTDGKNSEILSFSRDGGTVGFAAADDAVKLWSLDGRLLVTLKGHTDWINSISFSPDGETIATASDDRTVKLWNRNGKELEILRGHSDKVNSVSFSPDDNTIATASDDHTVKLWSKNGTLLKPSMEHNDRVSSVSFSPDGKIIASVSNDNIVKFWNKDGTLRESLTGTSDVSDGLSFSPDSRILALANSNEGLGLDIYILHSIWFKHAQLSSSDNLRSVSFSPDSKTIATARNNGVLLLSLDLDELLRRGCGQIRGYLKNNPNVSKDDRHLCDGYSDNKSP